MICPNCQGNLPLLSRICPHCNYVVGEDGPRPNASEFADTLEEILHEVKALPAPSFARSMGQLSVVMLPVLSLFLFVAALISEAGIFWIAFGLLALGSLWAIVLKICGRLGNGRADRRFAQLKNDFEYTLRIARRDFGQKKEVSTLLDEIKCEIDHIERSRRAASRRNLLLWLGILLIAVLLAVRGVHSVDTAVAVHEDTEWQEAVEAFCASGADDEYNVKGRSDVLKKILAAGEPAAAERFFREHCMGRVGDYDCAATIVEYYLRTNDRTSAERFIETCELRYKSDHKKLKNL